MKFVARSVLRWRRDLEHVKSEIADSSGTDQAFVRQETFGVRSCQRSESQSSPVTTTADGSQLRLGVRELLNRLAQSRDGFAGALLRQLLGIGRFRSAAKAPRVCVRCIECTDSNMRLRRRGCF